MKNKFLRIGHHNKNVCTAYKSKEQHYVTTFFLNKLWKTYGR